MQLVWLVPVTGVAAILFALWLAWDVLRRDAGSDAMQEIAGMIFEGAMAFLRRQYRTIAIMAALTAVAIFLIVGGVSEGVKEITRGSGGDIGFGDTVGEHWEEAVLTGTAFLVGAVASAPSGFVGMYIAVRSNVRTAAAAQ